MKVFSLNAQESLVYDIDGKVLDSMLCTGTIFINAWALDDKCYEVNMYRVCQRIRRFLSVKKN